VGDVDISTHGDDQIIIKQTETQYGFDSVLQSATIL